MGRQAKNIIEYRIYELQPDMPFMCLSGEEWRISDVMSDRLHFHNCLEIGFCLSDSGLLGFENGVTYPFKAGDVFLIPRFLPHTTCSAPGCRSRWDYLFVDLDATAGSGARSPQQEALSSLMSSYLHITQASHPRIYFLANCLLEEARDRRDADSPLFSLYSLLLSAVLRILLNAAPNRPKASSHAFVLRPALEYINNHYVEPCNVEKLAGLCHLSQTHFRRLFLSIMGTTPLQYVIYIRIRQACIRLNTTSDPITAIAQAVGISSISSFNRNFQQIMGVSPQQYRQASKHIAARQKQYILPCKGWMLPENL